MSETESTTAAHGTRTAAEMTSEVTPSIECISDFLLRWQDAWNSHDRSTAGAHDRGRRGPR